MEKRKLGNTGLEVTVLGYGAGALSANAIPAGKDDAADKSCCLLNRLLDDGINFIDTAPDYGNSEEIIGKTISHRRAEFYLATKCGCNIPILKNCRDNSHIWTRDRLMKNIELSLKRMNTDHVDIWQLHNPIPSAVSQGGLVEVMEQVKKQGKVRYVSISTALPDIRTYIDWRVFATFQIPYSALYRQHEQAITAAAKAGAGIIISGGVAEGEPKHGLAGDECWKVWLEADLDELRGAGENRTMFLLRFAISHPEMHTAIIGTNNPDHLEENLKAAEAGPLSAGVYAEAKHRLDAIGQTSESVAD